MAELHNHWWWRPGWQIGRSFYTWHITFDGVPEMASLVDHYASLIDHTPGFDSVGITGLHLTLQGLGFTDEIARPDVDRIVEATRSECRSLKPFVVSVGPAQLDPECIRMPVAPVDPVIELRKSLRQGISTVWGKEGVPESMDGFRPHVSLAYTNADGPAQRIRNDLAEYPPQTRTFTVSEVSLINLNRDRRRYEWTDVAKVHIGQ